jgi:hypothetical protein
MTNIEQLIQIWPRPIDLARDLGVSPSRITDWKNRNSVPVAYWQRILAAARRRGHPEITAELLVELHAPGPKLESPGGLGEEDRPFEPRPESHNAIHHEATPTAGHFSQFRHLRKARFRTLQEINDHIDALRDEWSRR